MDVLQQAPFTKNHTNAGFVAGTTNTLTSTAATSTSVRGKFSTALAIMTNSATTPTVDANTGLAFPTLTSTSLTGGQAAILLFGVNAAGVIKMAQGAVVQTELGSAITAGNFIAACQFPPIPDNFTAVAYTVVRTSPTGNLFVAGTTAWAATGITCSVFQNITTLPDRPQTA